MSLGQLAFLILALFLVGVTIWLAVREIRKWRDRSTIISMNQLVIRLINCALLLWLVSWFSWGVLTFDETDYIGRHSLIFWNNCMMLGLIVIAIAIFDFTVIWIFRRRTSHQLREETRDRHTRMLAELESDRARFDSAKESS